MVSNPWSAVDDYFVERLVKSDPIFQDVLDANAAAGLPPIDVSPAQGKLLQLLVQSIGARHVLEVGTLGGYSTIWMAQPLPPSGHLVSLEIDPHHADVARKNVQRAGLQSKVTIHVGPALETLPQLKKSSPVPFDFVFIDADKEHNAEYFDWALKLSRSGALIVVDNVVRNGAVIDAHSSDSMVRGVRRLMDWIAKEKRVSATVIQTVGRKGYDGFLLARVL